VCVKGVVMFARLMLTDAAVHLGTTIAGVFEKAGRHCDRPYDSEHAWNNWDRHEILELWVENFCIDMLAGRTNVSPRATNLLGGTQSKNKETASHDLEGDSMG